MRSRPSRQSTEVVNQLMLSTSVGAGSLLSRNGPNFTFFEIDEQLLLMLVRLICRDRELPVEGFLGELRRYGLAPQDDDERAVIGHRDRHVGEHAQIPRVARQVMDLLESAGRTPCRFKGAVCAR